VALIDYLGKQPLRDAVEEDARWAGMSNSDEHDLYCLIGL
jgi:hypothetical protein